MFDFFDCVFLFFQFLLSFRLMNFSFEEKGELFDVALVENLFNSLQNLLFSVVGQIDDLSLAFHLFYSFENKVPNLYV